MRKGDFNKSYNFPSSVSKEDIKSLLDIIAPVCEEFSFDFKTKDGAKYTVDNIEEVLTYSNPNSRKIIRLDIKGNLRKGNHFIFPNISIILYDSSIHGLSCRIDFNKLEEKDIIFYSQQIDEVIQRTKMPYWWLHQDAFYWCVGIILYLILGGIFLYVTNDTEPFVKLQVISALCMFSSMFLLEKIISYLYPKGCFYIGEQEKFKNKKNKTLAIWSSVISTILLGVCASIIAHFVIKQYF